MTDKSHSTYRSDIDGLRALAVLPVVLFHAGFSIFNGGFVGVDVFFVISGFLITGIISGEIQRGSFSVLHFYERRIRRIFPALFTVLIFTTIVACLLLLPEDLKSYSQSLASATLFASNIFFWEQSGYFDTAAELKPLLHTWSLAVEEQFYIFFPLFLMLAWRFGRYWRSLTWAALVFSLILSIYGVRHHDEATFYLLPTRAWELLAGSVIALNAVPRLTHQMLREALAALGMALILIAVFTFDKSTLFPGENALLPCLGAALIIYTGSEGKPTFVAQLLSWKPIVQIGLISYSLYLWHWPLIVFAKYYAIFPLTLIESSLIVLLSIALAWLSWRYIEAPFRKGNATPFTRNQPRIFAVAGVAMCAAIVIGLGNSAANGWPQRVSPVANQIVTEAGAGQTLIRPCMNSRNDANYKKPAQGCVFGPDPQFADVILWGDSHAGAILPGLVKALPAGKHGILTVIMSGCPPLQGVNLSFSHDKNCKHFNSDAIEYMKTAPQHSIVLVGRWAAAISGDAALAETKTFPGISMEPGVAISRAQARDLLREKLTSTIKELVALGKQVYLVYPTPEGYDDIPSVLARLYARQGASALEEQNISASDYDARTRDVIAIFDALPDAPNFHRIKPADMLCNDSRCLIFKDGKSLYYDDDHLSKAGAEYIAPLFAPIFANEPATNP